jgi:hypothetical protein
VVFNQSGQNVGEQHNHGSDVEAQKAPRAEQPDRMLQHFEYWHLPSDLQGISIPFHDLAHRIVQMLPMNAERTVALRKLLEAKDCAVRAKLYKEPGR